MSCGAAPITGRCLCGAIRFELAEPPIHAGYCHCRRCQRRTGTGSSASARIAAGSLRITQGEERLRGWRAPAGGFEKCFCADCGAHLLSRNPDYPHEVGIRMSAFDEDPGVRPSYRAFVAYAAPWEQIPDDGLPRYEERGPR